MFWKLERACSKLLLNAELNNPEKLNKTKHKSTDQSIYIEQDITSGLGQNGHEVFWSAVVLQSVVKVVGIRLRVAGAPGSIIIQTRSIILEKTHPWKIIIV